MKRIALIDFDILVYRCGCAAQHTEYYVHDKANPEMGWVAMFRYKKEAVEYCKDDPDRYIESKLIVEPESHAYQNMRASMQSIMAHTRSDKYKGFLSGDNNYREKIATIRPYKGNRDPAAKPVHYQALRDFVIMQYNAEIVEGQEADDALGITQYSTESDATIICTIDKDLNMIPGWHFNFVTKEMYYIEEPEALKFFYTQLLTGDPVDNIQGIPGTGKVGAEKLLDGIINEKELYKTVWKAYSEWGCGYVHDTNKSLTDNQFDAIEKIDSVLLENARLLWIRRKENELWTPPTI